MECSLFHVHILKDKVFQVLQLDNSPQYSEQTEYVRESIDILVTLPLGRIHCWLWLNREVYSRIWRGYCEIWAKNRGEFHLGMVVFTPKWKSYLLQAEIFNWGYVKTTLDIWQIFPVEFNWKMRKVPRAIPRLCHWQHWIVGRYFWEIPVLGANGSKDENVGQSFQ